MRQLFAIGDIHGEYDKLIDLLAQIEAMRIDHEPQTIVFLGDYVDRGPKSMQVIDHLMDGSHHSGDVWICLKGNHEDMMIDWHGGGPSEYGHWAINGGVQTLDSYGGMYDDVPKSHIDWMRSLPFYHETENHIFVHGGFMPYVELENQTENVCMWIRNRFLDAPMGQGFEGWKHIVHGHTPVDGPDIRFWRTNLDTGACFGDRPLTAALFDKDKPGTPVSILQAK
jgi:serine/threonine protein phosphatase 1